MCQLNGQIGIKWRIKENTDFQSADKIQATNVDGRRSGRSSVTEKYDWSIVILRNRVEQLTDWEWIRGDRELALVACDVDVKLDRRSETDRGRSAYLERRSVLPAVTWLILQG